MKLKHILLLAAFPALFFCYSFIQETAKKQEPAKAQAKKSSPASKKEVSPKEIKWLSFQQAIELNKKTPKKIFIDVYTGWCGWCKVMDKKTFTDPVIIKNISKYYYAVKLDAEMKDTVVFKGQTFVNPSPGVARSTHQLAIALLNGQLSYPTTVYMDENMELLTPVAGYLVPQAMEPILRFFGEDAHKTKKWEEYQKSFKTEIPAEPAPPGN